MDLYLQLGHGMMGYCEDLITQWGEGTVILSPRDLTEEQTKQFSNRLHKLNGKTLFDPQYYNPRAEHYKLIKWSHWLNDFDTSLFSDDLFLESKFINIKQINDYCQTEAYIIPSPLCEEVDRFWINEQTLFIKKASKVFNDKEKYITLALTFDVIIDEKAIEKIIDISSTWEVEGYYIVPEGQYLEDNSFWLINLAQLVAGLKLQNKKVIVGYSNHQMLSLACANVDAIASGTFLNVRSFNAGKFDNPEIDAVSRRSVWYYCPQTMSEYGKKALDRAYDKGVLEDLKPFGTTNKYIDILFSGAAPSTVQFGDSLAFRHYLFTLKNQCLIAKKDTFEKTIDYHKKLSDNAYELIRNLSKKGVREMNRSFSDIIELYQKTLDELYKERGSLLKRKW
ncbi:hypothetical protein SUSP_002165 [Sulfurospirillum sp. 'SP']|nr:hypothetical protein [Sulfurospirillum sp. 'SP']WNY99747.1 hypothetical protein SUSP_002165 [Sulfurospirillum sp. 'SP']